MFIKKTLFALSAVLLAARWAKGRSVSSAAIDPAMQKVLDALKQLGPKPIETLSAEDARKQPLPADAVKALMKKENIAAPSSQTSVSVQHLEMNGPQGPVPLHVYTPAGTGPFPVLLYFHGGGFVIAQTADYDASPRALAEGAGAVVVAVDYHRAPEHKFPAAPNDAYAAYQWVREHAAEIGGDPQQIAIAGESAGGNLATVVCMMARNRNEEMPLHQLLIYPVVDNDMNRESYRINAKAKPLNKAMMKWFFGHYASPRDALNPYALPMKAGTLADLPDATIITAEIDPLRSEGQAYAERLLSSGVAVVHRDYPGVTHEFFGMGAVVPAAREAERFASDRLKQAFTQERFRLSRLRVLQDQAPQSIRPQ
jgi:acetyl esterase